MQRKARAGTSVLVSFDTSLARGGKEEEGRRRRLWNISPPPFTTTVHARLSGQAMAKPYQDDTESTCSSAVRPGRSASTRHASCRPLAGARRRDSIG